MVRAITAVRDIERDGLCVFFCLAKGLEGAFHAPVALAACASPYPSRGILWRPGCVADLSEIELEFYRHSLCLGSSSDGDSGSRAAWPACLIIRSSARTGTRSSRPILMTGISPRFTAS